jgi:hypothetical protein
MRALLTLLLLVVSSSAAAGYDLHITRKSFWANESGPVITFDEWNAYVRSDRQISHDPQNTEHDFLVKLPGETFPVWYNPSLGEIYTKNPTEAARQKLIEISRKLKANVQGDDGEFYPSKP